MKYGRKKNMTSPEKLMQESIECMRENDLITELAVKQLGKSLDKKHPPKSELGEIFKILNKTLKLKKRINTVQSDLAEKLLDGNSK